LVAWPLSLLTRLIFKSGAGFARRARRKHTSDDPLQRWLYDQGPATRQLTILTVLVCLAVVGFHATSGLLPNLVCFTLNIVCGLMQWPFLRLLFAAGRRTVPVLGAAWVLAIPLLVTPDAALACLTSYQLVVLGLILAQTSVATELLTHFLRYPALLAAVSFGGVIAIGTLLLSLPAAGSPQIAPIDALFTATSAVCVTGLTVVDTGAAFTHFGQVVILVLIQVGGLGIMVLSAFAALLVGGKLGLQSREALVQTLDLQSARQAYRLTVFMVVTTLGIELVGGLCLAADFFGHGLGLGEALWRGMFHSISAFCNAGFGLYSDNLVSFNRDPWMLCVVAVLITLGGLGFSSMVSSLDLFRRGRWLSAQVKVVLLVSALLTLGGTILIAAVEWQRSLAGLGVVDKIVNAFFQSVTTRTAGFNSVDLRLLSPATVVIMIVLMFVGASPGGTGGGIKTTTAAVLFGAMRAIAAGQTEVVLFGRRVSQAVVFRSIAIAVIAASVATGAIIILALTQDLGLTELVFETVSALGTVGLSLGITSSLDPFGKLLISAVMFAGRLGPLTLALLLSESHEARLRFPETRMMVG
jgi:trk system potassium uptake protein TrkH